MTLPFTFAFSLQFRYLFIGITASNNRAGVSNYSVRVPYPSLVLPKRFSAAQDREIKRLAQLIEYTFGGGRTRLMVMPYE